MVFKIILEVFIFLTFVSSFFMWRNKKLKIKTETYGAMLLFLTTLFGLIFLGIDRTLIKAEHPDYCYYIQLIIYVSIDIISLVCLYAFKKGLLKNLKKL